VVFLLAQIQEIHDYSQSMFFPWDEKASFISIQNVTSLKHIETVMKVEFSSCLFLNYRSVLRMKCAFDFCEFSY
jgi:hypothetical protein